MLIRIFAEKSQGFDFIYPIGPENCEGLRGIDAFCASLRLYQLWNFVIVCNLSFEN